MTTLLLQHADVLLTMDAARREIPDGAVLIRDGVIESVGTSAELTQRCEHAGINPHETINLHGHVLTPGLINTHHHMYQSLTRAMPAAQDAELFDWLRALYPVWAGLTPEMVHVS